MDWGLKRASDAKACGAGPFMFTDVDGDQWRMEGATWCQLVRATGRVQAWMEAAPTDATHKLITAGKFAVLAQAIPLLAEPAPASEGKCIITPRSAEFLKNNQIEAGKDIIPCAAYRAPGFVLTVGRSGEGDFAMPLIQTTPTLARRPGKIVLYVGGGPYGGVLKGLERGHLLSFMLAEYGRSYTFILPAFLGSDPLYRRGTNNLRFAVAEVGELLKRTNSSFPNARICVIGGSLGGYLAGHLATAHPDISFLAINPLLSSPGQMSDTLGRSSKGYTSMVKIKMVERGGPASASPESISSGEAFERYFGEELNVPLADVLASRPKNFSIAYSPADPKIGVEQIPLLERLLPNKLTAVSPVGHAYQLPENFWAFRRPVADFLENC